MTTTGAGSPMAPSLPKAPITCQKCGEIHQRCAGHNRAGKPCGVHPIRGGAVCQTHGGRAPQVKAAAKRRLASAEALRRLHDVDIEPIDDPLEALGDLAARARAWMLQMSDMVDELERFRFTDDKGAEHLDARVALLERAMDRLQKFLKDWVQLGFDERKVQVDEAKAALMAACMQALLEHLGHDPEEILPVLDLFLPMLDGAPAPVIDVLSERTA